VPASTFARWASTFALRATVDKSVDKSADKSGFGVAGSAGRTLCLCKPQTVAEIDGIG
jgi:hypothetical protein